MRHCKSGAMRLRLLLPPRRTWKAGAAMPYTTLISTDELAPHLDAPSWVVLDCRHDLTAPAAGRSAYEAGHIPGAQFADLDNALSDKSAGPNGKFRGRHPLPERTAFVETLRGWGINHGSQVIAY